MTWQQIAFTLPDTVDALASDASVVLDAISADGLSASLRLSEAIKPIYTSNAISSTAADIVNTVDADTKKTIAITVAHPWINGIYQQGPVFAYLSARNAVNVCARKINDVFDACRSEGSVEVLVMVISADTYQQLGAAIASFRSAFHLPELGMLQRRCEQIASLEKTKLEIPEAASYPLFTARDSQQLQPVRLSADLLHCHFSIVDAYADQNITPAMELSALISEKAAHIDQIKSDYQTFKDGLTGGVGTALFLSASSAFNQSQLLKQHASALTEKPLALAVMLTGEASSLTVFKQMVGL